MSTKPWRDNIELAQSLGKHKTFTHTTTSSSAENVVLLAGNMEECTKISLVVETADAYIEFDSDATTSSMLVPANEGYFDVDIYISTKISVLRSGGTNARVRGIIWGR
tara:strand:+ start:1660 stop:1983 length:324 start_codon:yes stop_codon:yes gene_type:complete